MELTRLMFLPLPSKPGTLLSGSDEQNLAVALAIQINTEYMGSVRKKGEITEQLKVG
jgi:hypothetical protein